MAKQSMTDWEKFKNMKIPPQVALINAIITTAALTGAFCLYLHGMDLDRNLAYTAMYYDDLAVELYKAGFPREAVLTASSIADEFCELYLVENRTLSLYHYKPLCDAIHQRTKIYAMCYDVDINCSMEMLSELTDKILAAEPLAKDLKENPPYFSVTMRYGNEFKTDYGEDVIVIPEVGFNAGDKT